MFMEKRRDFKNTTIRNIETRKKNNLQNLYIFCWKSVFNEYFTNTKRLELKISTIIISGKIREQKKNRVILVFYKHLNYFCSTITIVHTKRVLCHSNCVSVIVFFNFESACGL